MSFSHDPFAETTIVFNGDATMEIRCNSCGGGHHQKFNEDNTLYDLQETYYAHLLNSHDLKPKCGYVKNVSDYAGPGDTGICGFLKCTLDMNHKGNHHLEMVNQ